MRLTRVLVTLVLFGVAFAYVEAAVVVYLRTIYEPIREQAPGTKPDGDVFPLATLKQLEDAGPQYTHLLWTELGRELATMLMLAAIALAIARNFRQWLAALVIAFGVWDIFYYVWLKLLIGWPASLCAWDILFLLPVPWVGPVLSPLLVAVAMIAAGAAVLWRESGGRPVRFAWFHWLAIIGGGLIIVVAFCWDFTNTSAGGWPNQFNWPLFALGLAIASAGFGQAFFTGQHRDAVKERGGLQQQ